MLLFPNYFCCSFIIYYIMVQQHPPEPELDVFDLTIVCANFSKASLQLKLVLAEVSIYSIPHESAKALAAEYCTFLSCSKSCLFPTNNIGHLAPCFLLILYHVFLLIIQNFLCH